MNQRSRLTTGASGFYSTTAEAEASIVQLRRAYRLDPDNGALAAQLAVELHRLRRPLDPGLELATLWHRFRTDPTNGNHARALLGKLTRDGSEIPVELLEALLEYYLSQDVLVPKSITGCVRPLVNLGKAPDIERVWARLEVWARDPQQMQAATDEMRGLEPVYRAVTS